MRLKTVCILLLSILAWTLAAHAAPSDNSDSASRKLEGTWRVQVTLRNCETGEQVGNPFQSLLTFARGGTMTETTTNPTFFPAERGPGHGVWSSLGGHTYSARIIAFITRNGNLTMTQELTLQIEIGDNPDELTTAVEIQFFDPDGALLRSGCATAVAQRFE